VANKLTILTDAIDAKLQALVAAGTVKGVSRGIIDPLKHKVAPWVALALSRLRRDDRTWIAQMLIQVLPQRASTVDPDEAITDLIAEIEAQLDALRAACTAGGVFDRPNYEYWYTPGSGDFPTRPIGAIGMLDLRIDAPLKIT